MVIHACDPGFQEAEAKMLEKHLVSKATNGWWNRKSGGQAGRPEKHSVLKARATGHSVMLMVENAWPLTHFSLIWKAELQDFKTSWHFYVQSYKHCRKFLSFHNPSLIIICILIYLLFCIESGIFILGNSVCFATFLKFIFFNKMINFYIVLCNIKTFLYEHIL